MFFKMDIKQRNGRQDIMLKLGIAEINLNNFNF